MKTHSLLEKGRWENRVLRGQPQYSEDMELGGPPGKKNLGEPREMEKGTGTGGGQAESSSSPWKKSW